MSDRDGASKQYSLVSGQVYVTVLLYGKKKENEYSESHRMFNSLVFFRLCKLVFFCICAHGIDPGAQYIFCFSSFRSSFFFVFYVHYSYSILFMFIILTLCSFFFTYKTFFDILMKHKRYNLN